MFSRVFTSIAYTITRMFKLPGKKRRNEKPPNSAVERLNPSLSRALPWCSKGKDAPCSWCSQIDLCSPYYPVDSGRHQVRNQLQAYFHTPCECWLENASLPSSTCGFCRHLNLRHLICCIVNWKPSLIIWTDWYSKQAATTECQFCQFMANILQYKDISKVGLYISNYLESDHRCLELVVPRKCLNFTFFIKPNANLGYPIDWSQIRALPGTTTRQAEYLPNGARVIDVARSCIVSPSHPVNYVALSYVWGPTSGDHFQATLKNIQQLEIEGSLSRIQLPLTIQDAMLVCRHLGLKYLWVDRLCILQDDEDSKHGQITCMDRIFGSSTFTIVALTGSNACSGLSGVSGPWSSHLTFLEWQGLGFCKRAPLLRDIVARSTWGQRGWTFQEELCSSRIFYFTDHGIYYSEPWEEENERFPKWNSAGQIRDAPLELIEEYTMRSFSFPGDILRAFTGVLTKMYAHEHRFGIPFDKFDAVIHWQPCGWTYQRRTSPNKTFPSWSWSSVQGGVRIPRTQCSTIFVASWALPDFPGPGESKILRWVSACHTLPILKWMAVKEGILNAENLPSSLENSSGKFLCPSLLSVFEEDDRRRVQEKPGRALVFTLVATFGMSSNYLPILDGRYTFSIRSTQRECVGGIWLTSSSAVDASDDKSVPRGRMFEFLALSFETILADQLFKVALGTVRGELVGPLTAEQDETGNMEVINAMLILRDKDTGVARRLGIGQVLWGAWFNSKPKLKAVVLE